MMLHAITQALLCLTAMTGMLGGSFAIPWYTIDGGGGTSQGAGYMLTGTIGQHDAGAMVGGDFQVAGGFHAAENADPVPPCPGDFDGSGAIDSADLLSLLSLWGPCPGCPEDLDESGSVNSADLLMLLGSWGDCP